MQRFVEKRTHAHRLVCSEEPLDLHWPYVLPSNISLLANPFLLTIGSRLAVNGAEIILVLHLSISPSSAFELT